MRQRWLQSLALSLGILVTGQGIFLRADSPAPVIEPYPPVEAPKPKVAPTENDDSAPAASLERPIPLDDERPVDRKIQPTGLFSNTGENTFAFSPGGNLPVARPMPSGPASNSIPQSMPAQMPTVPSPPDVPYSWRQPPTTSPIAQDMSSAPIMPMPSRVPGSKFGTTMPMAPGSSFGMDSTLMGPGTVVSPGVTTPPGTIVSPGLVPSPGSVISQPGTMVSPDMPGTIVSPGAVPTPGVVAGPMGGPILDDGCMGGGCTPGCASPGCCAPDCCTNGCCAPGCCNGACCEGCCGWGNGCGCCFGDRFYGSVEYLLWFIRGQSLPPLLTTGPATAPILGALGQSGTSVLYGNAGYTNNPYSGTRLRLGYWFNDNHGLGLDVGGFVLGGNSKNFAASSVGTMVLARPFFNALTGVQDSELVAAPGLAGRFSAVNTFFLYGAEANLRRNFCCGCNWFIDGFIGWRMLGLNESLSMTENLAAVSSTNPALLPSGTTFLVNDRFATSNLFNGGQIGAIGEYRLGRWSFDLRTSMGVGGTMQYANVSGSTTSAAPGVLPSTLPGGLLALSSNIGSHTRSMVSFVDEVGLNVGYQFTNHIRAFAGYNFLFWSNVIRPGGQIDTTVNPNLLPPAVPGGPNRPAFTFNGSNFWVQGVQFGLDIRW